MKHQSMFFSLVVILLLSLLVSACGSKATTSPASGSSGDAAAGKTLFEGTCSACHGMDAKGLPNLGVDLTTSTFVKSKSDTDLVAFLKVGRPGTDPASRTQRTMPPKGGNDTFTDTDLANIVAYLRTLQK